MTILQKVIAAFEEALIWLQEGLADKEAIKSIAEDLGIDQADVSIPPEISQQRMDSIAQYRTAADPTPEAFLMAVDDITAISEVLMNFKDDKGDVKEEVAHAVLGLLVTNYIRFRIPWLYWFAEPFLFFEGLATSDPTVKTNTISLVTNTVDFLKALKNVGAFVLDLLLYAPSVAFRKIFDISKNRTDYFPPLETEDDAKRLADFTFLPTAIGLAILEMKLLERQIISPSPFAKREGVIIGDVIYGWEPSPTSTTPVADQIADRTLTLSFIHIERDSATESELEKMVSSTLTWVPRVHGGPGLLLTFGGSGKVQSPVGSGWKLTVKLSSASAVDFLISSDGLINGPEDASATFTLERMRAYQLREETFAKLADEGIPANILNHLTEAGLTRETFDTLSDGEDWLEKVLKKIAVQPEEIERYSKTIVKRLTSSVLPEFIPDGDGTRLEFDRLAFSGEISSSGAGVKVLAQNSALVLAVDKDGDGFLKEIMPAGETRIGFDLGIGYSSQRGFYLEGGTGLEVILPISKTLRSVTLQQLMLRLMATTEAKPAHATAEISVALGVKLGPVEASVDRLGIQFRLEFPENAKSDISIGFKPPSGIGILIDSESITGGGFISFDPENHQYAGFLQLEIDDRFALQAICLLNTRLPDGSKGYSLLIIISVEFDPPVQLVLGFNVGGIGGYLGIHRTMNIDVLRDGLRHHTLDAILFPKDVIKNAPQILQSLRSVFPPTKGHHLLGLAVIISWGTPPLVTAELAVIYEFGDHPRLVILGQLRLAAPQVKPLIEIHMDAIGVWDIDRKEFSLDARLYDSNIAGVTISGDMALRVRRGTDPFYLLSVGGYNPHFNIPADFPKLDRLTVTFANSKDFRLILTGYFAVSSNTRQAGGKFDFFAGFAGFSIEGYMSIDVLWEADARFISDFDIKVALKYHGRTLLGAHAVGTLYGPKPKRLRGEVSISLFLFDVSKSFDVTIGDDLPPLVLPPIDPLPDLIAALQDPRSWSASLPDGAHMLVSVRKQPDSTQILLHPQGELAVRQQVLPLGIHIDYYNGGTPSAERSFNITGGMIGTDQINGNDLPPVNEFFAPAQFIAMSDDEKIARPSFESLPAGVKLTIGDLTFGGQMPDTTNQMVSSDITFEEKTIAADGTSSKDGVTTSLGGSTVRAALEFGAAANSRLRSTGSSRYRVEGKSLRVNQPVFVVAELQDLTTFPIGGVNGNQWIGQSYTAMQQTLDTHSKRNPLDKGGLQVIVASQVGDIS